MQRNLLNINLFFMPISSYIDHTNLKKDARLNEIEKLCKEAIKNRFASVCVPPYYIKTAAELVKDSEVKVCTVIGFPFGYCSYTAKAAEMRQAMEDGANELDVVINLAALKNQDFEYLEKEMKTIMRVAKSNFAVLKLIIETGLLTKKEIVQCCELYGGFEVDFIKTSTGFIEEGATVETVQLLRKHLPEEIQIKASGGIRNLKAAKSLLNAGATRLGCSNSLDIIKEEKTAAKS